MLSPNFFPRVLSVNRVAERVMDLITYPVCSICFRGEIRKLLAPFRQKKKKKKPYLELKEIKTPF